MSKRKAESIFNPRDEQVQKPLSFKEILATSTSVRMRQMIDAPPRPNITWSPEEGPPKKRLGLLSRANKAEVRRLPWFTEAKNYLDELDEPVDLTLLRPFGLRIEGECESDENVTSYHLWHGDWSLVVAVDEEGMLAYWFVCSSR